MEPGLTRYELRLDGAVRLFLDRDPSDVAGFAGRGDVRVPVIEADGRRRSLDGWEPLTWRGSAGSVERGPGFRYEMESGASDVIGGIVPGSDPLPVLVSPGIASADGPIFPATLGGQEELDPVAGLQFPSMIPNAPFIVLSRPRSSNGPPRSRSRASS